MSDLRGELENIRNKHGRLTPALVLEEARSSRHPLHARFEWDDGVAGERYRLEQAHDLISEVRVSYSLSTGERRSVRGFHAVRASDVDQYDYEPIEDVLADPFKRKIVLADMQRQIGELVARYEHIGEFWQILKQVSRRKKAS